MKITHLIVALAGISHSPLIGMEINQAPIAQKKTIVERATISQLHNQLTRNKAIKELFDNQVGSLNVPAIKQLIAEYSSGDMIHVHLETPEKLPWLFGCARWQPHYPPINSLEFQGNALVAKAKGSKYARSFVITWSLNDGSCMVNHTGLFSQKKIYTRGLSPRTFPIIGTYKSLTAELKTQCIHGGGPRAEPYIYCRKKYIVQLTLPQSLHLGSILQGVSYLDLNKKITKIK